MEHEVEISVQRLFSLGIVDLGDVVGNASQRLSEYEDAKCCLCIPLNYEFIWETLQNILLLQGSMPMKANGAPWMD